MLNIKIRKVGVKAMEQCKLGLITGEEQNVILSNYVDIESVEEVSSAAGAAAGVPFGAAAGAAAK